MKKLMIKWINWYQRASANTTPTCRYYPTCSQYAKEAFEKRNFFVAGFLSLWRIIRCNPFSKGGYDPVPEKKAKKHGSLDYLNISLLGDDNKSYTLSTFKDKSLILYFFPNTKGIESAIIAKDFTFYREDFEKKGYFIIGISKSDVSAHQLFIRNQHITTLLLSDLSHTLSKTFDLVHDGNIVRAVVLLDEESHIKLIKPIHNVEGFVESLLETL